MKSRRTFLATSQNKIHGCIFCVALQIWREYDTDNSGYIEADELKNFLRDLLKEAKKINDVSEDKLIEYTDTMVSTKFFPDFPGFCEGLLCFVVTQSRIY